MSRITEIGNAVALVAGAITEAPDANRPRGVVYAKCFLKCASVGVWSIGTGYIMMKYIADPQTMATAFRTVALPAGVVLMGMSKGCLKLSLQADSLSSLKELWKRYTEGVLQEDLRKVLLTPDVLQKAEAGENVELEVQIDERIYKEACLDLMVYMVLQNSGNTSLSHRRSFSDSNLVVNSSKINKEFFLQVKPQATQESRQPKITDVTPPALTPEQQLAELVVPKVYFLNIDKDTVFEKVQVRRGGLSQQRIINGTVHMVATHGSTSQISVIKVWVFREPLAAELYGDKQDKQNLPVERRKLSTSTTHFSVNLDDVYAGTDERPFYELAKVDTKRRNVFQLSSLLYFNDGKVGEEFFSQPFRISTKGKQIRTDEPLSSLLTSFSSLSLSPDLPDDFIRVHTLVSDEVVASRVECGTILEMTSEKIDMVKAMEEIRTEKSFSCANFVRVDKLIARQIEYKAIITKPEDTQRPQVTESASKDEPRYVEKSMSHITAKTIIVDRLIVDHLFCAQLIKH